MHFSSQKNRIYFNEKEFATETWHLAEDSLAVALKCFLRVSPRVMTWAFVSDSGAIFRLKSTSQSPHPSAPFSLLSLSHLLVSKILSPLRKEFEAVDRDEGVGKSSEDSFDRENILLIVSVSVKKISTDVTQFHSCRRAELMSTGLAMAFIF